jgi:hypothetical protein
MTIFEVEEIFAYWGDHPPTHLMVAAYLGVKPSSRSRLDAPLGPNSAAFLPEEAAAFLMATGMPTGDIHEGLGMPTFDAAELMGRRPN